MSISAKSTTAEGHNRSGCPVLGQKQYMQHREGTKVEQMEKRFAKLELENKELRAELEKCQNEQQRTINALTELKVSIDQLSLKHQEELEKQSNAHENLIEEMKEQRKMDALKQQTDQRKPMTKLAR
ncbi:hypothetical protein GPALN_014544 [Globodera pallida]|nr:hypothetical protein GPALN_014544 [Globodera pallida]